MIDPDEEDENKQKMTARAVFIVGPDMKLKLSILYPATTGRNFNEVLRVIDSLFLVSYIGEAFENRKMKLDKSGNISVLFVFLRLPSGSSFVIHMIKRTWMH